MQNKNYIIIQPYGAAVVNNSCDEIEIINETALIMSIGLLEEKSNSEISSELCSVYDVNYDEALSDTKEFLKTSTASQFSNPKYKWEIEGNPEYLTIVEADIELTLECDFNCDYCSADAGLKDPFEISTEEWLTVAAWLYEMGAKHITISGGNPLLSPAFWPLTEYLTDCGISIHLFINGSHVQSETAKKLASEGVS